MKSVRFWRSNGKRENERMDLGESRQKEREREGRSERTEEDRYELFITEPLEY